MPCRNEQEWDGSVGRASLDLGRLLHAMRRASAEDVKTPEMQLSAREGMTAHRRTKSDGHADTEAGGRERTGQGRVLFSQYEGLHSGKA